MCAGSNLTTYVEVLYDEVWCSATSEVDPQFLRLWLPLENDMQVAEFLEVANQSVRPVDDDVSKSARKRGRSVREEEENEIPPGSCKFINSPHALATAVMNLFMGLSDKFVDQLEFNIPSDDDEFRPKSPMQVFKARTLFDDARVQRRWAQHRVPAWQRTFSEYVSNNNTFSPPPQAREIPGVMRQINPDAPWIAFNGGTMDALLMMSPSHLVPLRYDIDGKADGTLAHGGL